MTNSRYKESWKEDHEPYPLETCMPGFFAAGNGRASATARVASAVGEGCMAVKFVQQYLDE
jgi:thioredoxin reductase (NADPH)